MHGHGIYVGEIVREPTEKKRGEKERERKRERERGGEERDRKSSRDLPQARDRNSR